MRPPPPASRRSRTNARNSKAGREDLCATPYRSVHRQDRRRTRHPRPRLRYLPGHPTSRARGTHDENGANRFGIAPVSLDDAHASTSGFDASRRLLRAVLVNVINDRNIRPLLRE